MKLFSLKNIFKYDHKQTMKRFFGEELDHKYKERLQKLEELKEIDAGIEKLQTILFSN